MTEHDLKILPEYFTAVINGIKTFEIRYNDRHFRRGDTLNLHEWHGGEYSGELISAKVTYMITIEADLFGQKGQYAVMAIKVLR